MTDQASGIRLFSCVVATSGRNGGDGITMVTVGAHDFADAPTAARQAVAARFGCACHVIDIHPAAA